MHNWLVEIRLKDWEPDLFGNRRLVSFEEVAAEDAVSARHAAFDIFAARWQYEPAMRRKMREWGITPYNCCAPEAVQID